MSVGGHSEITLRAIPKNEVPTVGLTEMSSALAPNVPVVGLKAIVSSTLQCVPNAPPSLQPEKIKFSLTETDPVISPVDWTLVQDMGPMSRFKTSLVEPAFFCSSVEAEAVGTPST